MKKLPSTRKIKLSSISRIRHYVLRAAVNTSMLDDDIPAVDTRKQTTEYVY